ncbi:MAG TPA: hypothetical protein VHB21_27300 [Minicystis sp.]|nr:hypothetical protein [Minicystis sp.]
MAATRWWARAGIALALASSSNLAAAQEAAPGPTLPGGGAPTPMVPGAAPTAPAAAEAAPPSAAGATFRPEPGGSADDWMAFKLEGVHPFVGFTFIGGPSFGILTGGISGNANQLEGAYLFALRGGVYIDRNELAFEISPLTYQYYADVPGPTFQFTGTYGYLVPVFHDANVDVSWPIRVGAGMMAGNTFGLAFFQARADLVGLNVRVGHLLIDAYFPQFRYAVTVNSGEALHFLTWFGGASVSYAFD